MKEYDGGYARNEVFGYANLHMKDGSEKKVNIYDEKLVRKVKEEEYSKKEV